MDERLEFRRCFVCGPDNPIGIHLKIKGLNGTSEAEYTVGENHTGFENIMHGGIMCSILDDMMVLAVRSLGFDVVTAHISIDYKSPAYVGDKLVARGRVTETGEGRAIKTEGEITRGETVIAKATGVVVKISANAIRK